jgi:hypothetical protein
MAIVVTEQEFIEWKASRVTRAFMKALDNDREWLKEVLLAGSEDDNNIRGRAAALTAILAMTYEELMDAAKEMKDV